MLLGNSVSAQVKFELRHLPVTQNNAILPDAFAGGLNAATVNTIRLNDDAMEDLVIYDRATNKTSTFLAANENGSIKYHWAPEYENFFPAFYGWVRFRDYDCDGLKDIYTSSPLGIAVYHNDAVPPAAPSYTQVVNVITIPSQSGGGRTVNLQINGSDIPEIIDYDGDGDLDILAVFYQGVTMVYYKNVSKERTGRCGLDYEGNYACFGKFLVATECGQYATGQACRLAPPAEDGTAISTVTNPVLDSAHIGMRNRSEGRAEFSRFNSGIPGPAGSSGNPADPSTKRVLHNGTGSTAMHIATDSLYDLIMSDVVCNDLYYLKNVGTKASALYAPAVSFPPNGTPPVSYYVYPSAYEVDIDRDNVPDLISSPAVSYSDYGFTDFANSLWYYHASGPAGNRSYVRETNAYLQNQMIETGEEACPALSDYDADGDLDLFVADKGIWTNGTQAGGIALYKNTGSVDAPSFTYEGNNWLGLRAQGLNSIRPFFIDINGDGAKDLLLASARLGFGSNFRYMLNSAPVGQPYQFDTSQINVFAFGTEPYDFPLFYDVDRDGLPDMLLGKYDGRLQYYKNTGTIADPQFTLINDATGGLPSTFFAQNLSLAAGDFDLDGKADLITGDYIGLIRFYSDFVPRLNTVLVPDTELVWNPLYDLVMPYNVGGFMAPAIGDLDNDGYPDLIAGTAGGGLLYLANTTPYPSDSQGPVVSKPFLMSPNPAADVVKFNIEGKGDLKIYTLKGQLVYDFPLLGKINNVSVNLSDFANSVYVVKVITNKGVHTQRLVLNR